MRAIHFAAAALLLLFATSVRAAIGGGASAEDGTSTPEVREVRDETLTFGTVLSTTPDVSIDQIQFGLHPKNGMDITRYILESELGGSNGSVTWLADGDGTILFKKTKAAGATAKPSAKFLANSPSSSASSGGNQRQGTGLGENSANGGSSLSNVQTGFGSINNLTNPLGPGGSGDVALDRHVPLATLNPVPTPSFVFRPEPGAEGEFGGPSTSPEFFSYPDESGDYGEGEYGANWPQAALDTEHLPEPSTLSIFALGGLGLGLGVLRRAFRKPAK